jgi:wyosine [tRNA(Phe)-imidazoG37] synthetase (radical SAM superfamily)
MLKTPKKLPHVYGPVPSRRLGFSLGVDIVPFKICPFDCIYCQLGPTVRQSSRRACFFPEAEVLAQVRSAIARNAHLDHITFSGSGEPTLNTAIGRLIRKIKKMTDIPVVVLTNSSLLTRKSVREALLAADIVVPSLDAARAATFRRVNRALPSIRVESIIRALETFRREFRGHIWLEVMLVRGLNDSPADIRSLKSAIARIKPDKVQLNTVVRPPAEKGARPLGRRAMETIRRQIGECAEIVADFRGRTRSPVRQDLGDAILFMIKRRPVTVSDIAASLGRDQRAVRTHLERLLRSKAVRRWKHQGSVYYAPGDTREKS